MCFISFGWRIDMEVTLTEIWLFAWAMGATAMWMDARSNARIATALLKHFIEDPKARARMLEIHEEVIRETKRNATQ
jgi:hypothetical protein